MNEIKTSDTCSQNYHPVLTPGEYSRTFSSLGIKKANTRTWQQLLLGLLAGLYISVGSHLFLEAMNAGMGRIWAGAVFGVGLVLVVVAGAELFTGNIIMVIGTITRQFSLARMLRNWIAVYGGNLAGAYLFALMVWAAGIFGTPDKLTDMGTWAVKVAEAKLSLTFGQAFLRGVLCNMLVILAIIMSLMSKDIVSKIVCCILPIMAFVASGFEHCVANMYLIPAGLLAKGVPLVDQAVIWHNILPVTLGNIVGGVGILILHPNRIRQLAMLWGPKRENGQGRLSEPPADTPERHPSHT
ncbi:MAG: formate/nitrite transporter family protein [Victivallales bacterium]|jgi:formate/nitrite transporter